MTYEAEDSVRNAAADEFHEKLQMTVDVDARAANIRDPPLVAATRLEDSVPIVEAIAVAASDCQEDNVSEVFREAAIDTTAATHDHNDTAVEDDGGHERLEEQSQTEEAKKGEHNGATRKRSYLKIGILGLLCLLIGAAVGVGVGIGGSSTNRTTEAPTGGNGEPPIMDDVSASPSMGPSSTPSKEQRASLSPTRSPRTCIESFNLTLSKELDDLRTASSPLPLRRQIQVELPPAGQYVLSRDGITLIVNEFGAYLAAYNLTDESRGPERTEPLAGVNDIALSDDGLWLVVGSGAMDIDTSSTLVPFAPGGSLFLYQLNATDNWELVNEIEVGGGPLGGVFQVGIAEDGSTVSFLGGLGGDESIMFVQAYSNTEDAVLLPLGNALFEDWINYNTTTGIVDGRLFVCGTDGFIRAYDIVEGAWQQIGDSIPHIESAMFLATREKTRLVTASLLTGIEAFELQDSKWQPLDLRALNERVSSVDIVSVAVSSDGNEVLITEMVEPNGDVIVFGSMFTGQLFERVDNEYQLAAALQFDRPADVQTTQITDAGDVVFVLDMEVLYYARIKCES